VDATDAVDVLLVEDNPDDEELMLHSLRSHGGPVAVAAVRDGEEALEYLRATGRHADRAGRPCPRVILLDIKLPRVDGLEVLAEVKTDARLRHIPVVLFTSAGQESEVVRGYKLGANSYVVKPVDFERFEEVVRQLSGYWLRVNRGPETPVRAPGRPLCR
jgi:two-component system response regulator